MGPWKVPFPTGGSNERWLLPVHCQFPATSSSRYRCLPLPVPWPCMNEICRSGVGLRLAIRLAINSCGHRLLALSTICEPDDIELSHGTIHMTCRNQIGTRVLPEGVVNWWRTVSRQSKNARHGQGGKSGAQQGMAADTGRGRARSCLTQVANKRDPGKMEVPLDSYRTRFVRENRSVELPT